MTNLNIIKSVTELLNASDLHDIKRYNEIKELLNVNFLEQDILSTIKYIRGEYTASEEKIFLDICVPVINEI